MKQTKGNWHTYSYTDLDGIERHGVTSSNCKYIGEGMTEADAKLLASAPEMLEVLKAVNKYNWDCNQGRLDDHHKKTMRFGGLWNLVETTLKKLNAYETYPEVEGGE